MVADVERVLQVCMISSVDDGVEVAQPGPSQQVEPINGKGGIALDGLLHAIEERLHRAGPLAVVSVFRDQHQPSFSGQLFLNQGDLLAFRLVGVGFYFCVV